MRDLAELNLNDGGEPVHRAPPSSQAIARFEREFELALPEDYLRLLRYSNGGHPELDTIAPMGRRDIAERAVDHFFHLDNDEEGPESLWSAMRAWRPFLGPDQLPFATDAGGNPFVLDLSVDPPRVVARLHDENFAVVDIAPTFSDFIDGLELNPDYI